MMLFSKADQFTDFEYRAIVKQHTSVITPEHLVDFTKNDPQIGLRGTLFVGREGQVKPDIVISEALGLHEVA